MASFRKRGPYQWQAQVRKKGRPLQTKTFETRAEAEQWARAIEVEMDQGAFASRAEAESTTLRELLERYLEEVTPLKKGAEPETNRLRLVMRHPLARRFVAGVRRVDIARWRDERLRKVTAATVKRDLVLLGHVFEVARNYWLLPLVQLALETAMRQGELLRLRWEHIDLNHRTAHLPDTKNGEARTVPLSSTPVAVLRTLPRALHGDIFPSVTTEAVKRSYMRATRRAGIVDLRFHDLRHEATTRLFEKGLNIMEVASITGHKDLRMLRRYTHLKAEDLARKLG